MGDVDNKGLHIVGAEGIGKSLHISLSFTVNLKLLFKKSSF